MWFSFNRQTLADSGILSGTTDYHSHVLPGVDDGIATEEDAFKALRIYEKLEISCLWLTPHVMEDFPNDTAVLRKKFSDLSLAYTCGDGTRPVSLRLASENMLDSLFVRRLDNDDLLPIIDDKHLLVETSYYNPPFGFYDILARIFSRGYIPLLAHPERYCYMSMNDYDELRGRGVKLQLDLASLVGAYGDDAQLKARALLKKGCYSIAGSDLHNPDTFTRWLDIPISNSLLDSLRALIQSGH